METAELLGWALYIFNIILMSTSLGLVRYHILRDSECCVGSDCTGFLETQYSDFYDTMNGARTQFTCAIILYLLAGPICWLSKKHHIYYLPPRLALLVSLSTYIVCLLYCDNILRSFYRNPDLPECQPLSTVALEGAHLMAWSSLIVCSLLFYMYLAWQQKQVIDLGSMRTPYLTREMLKDIEDDEEEQVVWSPHQEKKPVGGFKVKSEAGILWQKIEPVN
jgi:hypothetical protein